MSSTTALPRFLLSALFYAVYMYHRAQNISCSCTDSGRAGGGGWGGGGGVTNNDVWNRNHHVRPR